MTAAELTGWHIHAGKVQPTYFYRFQPHVMDEAVELPVQYGAFNHFKIVGDEKGMDCYVNGAHVQRAELLWFPQTPAVATEDGDTVILKVVNYADREEKVEITADCQLESAFSVDRMSQRPEARNSFDDPFCVTPEKLVLTGAGNSFVYRAPAWSLNILKLKKRKKAGV